MLILQKRQPINGKKFEDKCAREKLLFPIGTIEYRKKCTCA